MDIQNYTTEHHKGQHLLAEERHEIEVRLRMAGLFTGSPST